MKITKTYSIEEAYYNAFDLLATEKKINKSSFIEELIKKFLDDNGMDYVGKIYESKIDSNKIVSVSFQDPTYYFLDDGSKIQKILFLHMFKEMDEMSPENFFNYGKSDDMKNAIKFGKTIDFVESVNPKEFFESTQETLKNVAMALKNTPDDIINPELKKKNSILEAEKKLDEIKKKINDVEKNNQPLTELEILQNLRILHSINVPSCSLNAVESQRVRELLKSKMDLTTRLLKESAKLKIQYEKIILPKFVIENDED